MTKVFFTAIFATMLLGFAACKQQNKSEQSSESTDVCAIDAAHNSRNSVNWQGTYTGIIPGANSDIKTTLTLNDSTYVLETVYLDKSTEVYKTEGKFVWNEEGSRITLDNGERNGFNTQFRVGENVLWALDIEGKQIEGDFADMYELHK